MIPRGSVAPIFPTGKKRTSGDSKFGAFGVHPRITETRSPIIGTNKRDGSGTDSRPTYAAPCLRRALLHAERVENLKVDGVSACVDHKRNG